MIFPASITRLASREVLDRKPTAISRATCSKLGIPCMNQAAARGQCQPAPGPALQQPRIKACGVITLYRSNIAAADPIGYSETCCFPGSV